MRFLITSTCFLGLVFGALTLDFVRSINRATSHEEGPTFERRILVADTCKGNSSERNPGAVMTTIWIFVVLYLFLGTAIVCDELFVPALEVIAEKWNLSDDVAGATLMAAGGSAPELATSLIGTFTQSDIGFGTIVGSAVFNVLFVIGMCALFTPSSLVPLKLTWWPLARDCVYYVLTLCTLACWFKFPANGNAGIRFWEAVLQFCMYLGYVGLMTQNERAEAYVNRVFSGRRCITRVSPEICAEQWPRGATTESAAAPTAESVPGAERPTQLSASKMEAKGRQKQTGCNPVESEGDGDVLTRQASLTSDCEKRVVASSKQVSFCRPTGFRAGILQLLRGDGGGIAGTTGVAIVTEISGDVDAAFDKFDRDKNGRLDLMELKRLLAMLGGSEEDYTEEAVAVFKKELNATNTDGSVSKADFKKWYIKSESRLKNKARWLFDQFDSDKDGIINSKDVATLICALVVRGGSNMYGAVVDEFTKEVRCESSGCNFKQFEEWYEKSCLWQKAKNEAEVVAKTTEGLLLSVMGDLRNFKGLSVYERCIVLYLLPLNLSLALTIPDCRPPGKSHLCYLTFGFSIGWIGAYSWFMVRGITAIGEQLGISTFIMGLTFLAAGTSVPDLLSSVVVAKQGKGDMAVSSSIGSNIFDVGVGLPLPWIIYTIVNWPNPVQVCNETIAVSISILLFMVLVVIASIIAAGWKMSHRLGLFMFFLYLLYVGQEILRASL